MKFVNYAQMQQDIRDWSVQFHNVKCVVGVPRSGMLVASLLGLHLNVPVVSVYDLLDRSRLETQLETRRGNRDIHGDWVVVDDSCATGGTLKEWRDILEAHGWANPPGGGKMRFGAMYALEPNTEGLDFYHRQISWPRRFEWNVFHSRSAELGLFDMDGVLCQDHHVYPYGDEPDEGEPHYDDWLDHMKNVKPLYIPTVPILGVVTSRLEKYRDIAEDWLERHGVQYGTLHMTCCKTARERRNAARHGFDKAQVYERYKKTQLFFESSQKQSIQIAEASGRAVLWVGGMQVIQPAAKKIKRQ